MALGAICRTEWEIQLRAATSKVVTAAEIKPGPFRLPLGALTTELPETQISRANSVSGHKRLPEPLFQKPTAVNHVPDTGGKICW